MKLRLIAVMAVLACVFCCAAKMSNANMPEALSEIPGLDVTELDNIRLIPRPECGTRGSKESEKTEFAHIVMSTPGTLDSELGVLKLTIDSISIEGPLNDDDFYTIWESSFYGSLKVVNLEKAVLQDGKIPDYAFFHLNEQKVPDTQFVTLYTIHLKKIILPEGLTEIGRCAFAYAISLVDIDLPTTLRTIGVAAFSDCIRLTTEALAFNEGLELIDTQAFYQCYDLKGTLRIPSSVRAIGQSTFYHCPISEVELPEGIEAMGGMAFEGSNFKSIYIPDGCMLARNGYQFYGNRSLEDVRLPETLEYLPDGIFDLCNLLSSIELPAGIERIGEGAFYETAIVEITLPDKVQSIGNDAFRSCVKLEKVTLPAALMTIGCSAFDYCPKLREITCMAPVPPECINEDAVLDFAPVFTGFPRDIPIYVPMGSGKLYSEAPGWDYFTNFIEKEFPGLSVDAVSASDENRDLLFDINGRRINSPEPGLPYIRNGKVHIRK